MSLTFTPYEELVATKEVRAEIRAALRLAIDAIRKPDPKEVSVIFDGAIVRIGIGRPAKDSMIWVSSLATLRCPTPRLIDAISREAGLQ